MQYARHMGVPFWPAASVLDTPYLVFDWYSVAAEAETRARPQLERRAREKAALAATLAAAANAAR